MITRKTLMSKVYKNSSGVLTSPYGWRAWQNRTHRGEDWDSTMSEAPKLYVPFNGIVQSIRTALTDDRGKYVEIKIGPWYLLFQHLATVSVKKGQRVVAGSLMAVQGGSGKTLNQYKSHSHVEWAKYPMGDSRRVALDPVVKFYPFFTAPVYPTKTVVVSDLRIRTGHGTDAPTTGKYAELKAYTIYETVLDDGYYWGRIDWVLNLWIALKTADGKRVYAK